MTKHNDVTVIGLGYIGLPTAVVLAASGASVCGVDVKPGLVEAVNAGSVPFVEPGLAEALGMALASDRLRASGTVEPADAYIIAVPTPFRSDRSPDLSFVQTAAESIAPSMPRGALVILESTSPPGTTRALAGWIAALRPDLDADSFDVAYCPERVLPGHIMQEVVQNDRVVGGLGRRAAKRAAAVYGRFCQGELLLTDAVTAEMTKLVENSFRDVNIAFANELSLLCDTVGVDVWELISLANRHPRVNILQPGPGVGGHCIAVDPWFLVAADPVNARLIETARRVNDHKPKWVVEQVLDGVRDVAAPKIAVLGLSFKPNIDDLRESPAVEIAASVAARVPAADLAIVEPHVRALPTQLAALPNTRLTSLSEALTGSDCVVLLVDHDVFRVRPEIPPGARVVDTRGAWGAQSHRAAASSTTSKNSRSSD